MTQSSLDSAAAGRMPALYLGHGAPPLLDDPVWSGELRDWAGRLPRPTAILIVSAHWESAPLSLSATATGTPLIYDFGGFAPNSERPALIRSGSSDPSTGYGPMPSRPFSLCNITSTPGGM